MNEFYNGWQIEVSRYAYGNFYAVWRYIGYEGSGVGGLTHEQDFASADYPSEAAVIERIKLHLDQVFPFTVEERSVFLPAPAWPGEGHGDPGRGGGPEPVGREGDGPESTGKDSE